MFWLLVVFFVPEKLSCQVCFPGFVNVCMLLGLVCIIRVLTRILKVGVWDSSSVKNRSPRPDLGVPLSKSYTLTFFVINKKTVYCISWFCLLVALSEYLQLLMIETNSGIFSIFSFHLWLWHSISASIFIFYSDHSFLLSIFIFILYPDIARTSSSVLPIVAHLEYLHSYWL